MCCEQRRSCAPTCSTTFAQVIFSLYYSIRNILLDCCSKIDDGACKPQLVHTSKFDLSKSEQQLVRSAAANPLDFLSQQTATNKFAALVRAVKDMVNAVERVGSERSEAKAAAQRSHASPVLLKRTASSSG